MKSGPVYGWATAVFLVVRHWQADRGVGLLFIYLLTFGVLHWLAPILNLLPWYETASLLSGEEVIR